MSFCFFTDKKDVAKNVYKVNQELGGGELSLSVFPGVGIDHQERKKMANPRWCARGGGGWAWLQVKLNHALDKQNIS